MKTASVRCDHCGSTYTKEVFDLDLKIGDLVKNVASEVEYEITDQHGENRWLYWGKSVEPSFVSGKILHDVRIDTRNYRFTLSRSCLPAS